MWAVRFWFGEFQEHHRQIERVRERERDWRREKESEREKRTCQEVFGSFS